MQNISCHIAISATPAAVFGALADPLGIATWWRLHNLGVPKHGRRRANTTGRKVVTTIEVADITPTAHIAWKVLRSDAPGNWTGTTISFHIAAQGEGTQLTFTHRGLTTTRALHQRIKAAWKAYMVGLKRYVEEEV